ncbi:MAG: polysulfide reductase NrfD [candidate division KSB1 bacterium]|nr:polysulfide reductase NrfD [candidate division KSB1 bacterium]MDZ7273655.1 polysulfide reductase NrfD [candidate division KSB1 bacterium]MDZ7285811.1 polysulfide reductase NrfD [candidate division KSB1 bacterium]MDZ7298843.1 polysulfide reductase NrfD [candidate division KSB1 bacterium]MDZ7350012.1 polysulfide reductase NrfD [candidate division KSB1 bacterium]
MPELDVTSGRNMHLIHPHLTIWGWEIPLYLFLGGLVAGILFFSALYFLRGKAEELPTVVRVTPLFAPFLLALGLLALFLDLEYKLHVFRFYTNIRLESPMSWGSWTLAVIFPLSVIWAGMHVDHVFPRWRWPWPWLEKLLLFFKRYARAVAWLLIVYAALLGMYTGILLSAFNARPFWNSAILGPLFLVSGLSTGLALNLLLSHREGEKHLLGRLDVMAISVELFLIIHLFMGFLASTQVHIDAAKLFLGGPYTASFWVFVVGLGLLLPMVIELLELRGEVLPTRIPALLVLFGGLLLRFIVVEAGQVSHWSMGM